MGMPRNPMTVNYLIPTEVVANLTQELTELDVELTNVNVVMNRTLVGIWVLSVLSGLVLAVELFDMYRNWGYKGGKYIPECESQNV